MTLTSVADAQAIAISLATPAATERVVVEEALGRVLREGIVATDDAPAAPTSMMDGFAVRAGAAGRRAIVEASAAGRPSRRALGAGDAAPISTGALLPPGADAIVPIEDASRSDHAVEVPATTAGRFVRQIGDELRRGERLLEAGVAIDAAASAILASQGRRDVEVSRRPRVIIWSTGAELRVAGEAREPGAIYDSNGPALAALCTEAGAVVAHRGMLGDDRDETVRALADVRHGDLVLVSGGVSVGEHDHVRPAIEAAGGAILLWRVAMKPGKPLLLARIGKTPIVGLPGNPVSAQVAFRLFVRPLLRAMLAATPADDLLRATVAIDAPLRMSTDRPTYLRARVRPLGERLIATLSPRQGSAALTSLVSTNAMVIVEPGEHELPSGALLPALLY